MVFVLIPSQVHTVPGVSTVVAPIFNLMSLGALNLREMERAFVTEVSLESAERLIIDFLRHNPASTLLKRRDATSRAVNGDGRMENTRILAMEMNACVCAESTGPDLGLETSSVRQPGL